MTVAGPNREPNLKHIRQMLPRHFRICALAVAGLDTKTIAEEVGMTPNAVGIVLRSPVAEAEMARLRSKDPEPELIRQDVAASRGKAESILNGALEKAALTQVSLLEAQNESVRLKATQVLLDRVFGQGPDSRRNSVINITAESVQLLALAIKESKNVNGIQQPANGSAADTTQDEQTNVREASEAGAGRGGSGSVQELCTEVKSAA